MHCACNLGSKNGLERGHQTLGRTMGLRVISRCGHVLNAKALKLVAKCTSELRAVVASQPLRQPIAHQPRVMKGTSICDSLLVGQEGKFSCFREVINNEGHIARATSLCRQGSSGGTVFLAGLLVSDRTQLKGSCKVYVHMFEGP